MRAASRSWFQNSPARATNKQARAARRDGVADSDIDVLVVSDDPELDDRVDDLAEQICRWTGNRAQVVGRTPKQIERLRRAKEPIVADWTRDLVVIVGDRATVSF